jgi:hypothetical protein
VFLARVLLAAPPLDETNPDKKELHYIIGWHKDTSQEKLAPFLPNEILHDVKGVIVTTASITADKIKFLQVISLTNY